jgi:hypothetical protein
MHIMEPPDLFERYLDPKFRHRVLGPIGADGKPKRGTSAQTIIDGLPGTGDADMQQHRKRLKAGGTQSTQPLSGSRLADTGRLDFAIKRNYDPEAQVMGMAMEGVDIAVLYPTNGLSILGRNDMDPELSLAICQAYNNWIAEFCRYSPERLKFVVMLPMHDVNLACRELVRGVRELGAIGSFVRPNMVNGHYWHSNYWDKLYTIQEDLNVTWGFHEGTGAHYSYHNVLYGENRFYRHVASHWIEMQQALIAMIIGGVSSFIPASRGISRSPELVGARAPVAHRVGLPAVPRHPRPLPIDDSARLLPPELLGRRRRQRARDRSHRRPHRRRPHVHLHRLPPLRLQLPHVAENLMKNVPRDMAAQIFMGGAHLYGLTEADFKKSDAAAATGKAPDR